jgi:outer membrane protein TolC
MNVFLAKLEIELSYENSRSTDTLFLIATAKYDKGNMTEQDYRQIELQSLNDKYMYGNAEKSYSEALQEIITYLGLSYSIDAISIVTPEFTLPMQIDLTEALYYVNKNNTAELNIKIKRLEAEQSLFNAKLSNMVNSDINFSYGINQYANNLIDAYRDPSRQQSVSIGLSIPVFQWGINHNRARIATNTYKSQMISIEQEQQKFDDDVKNKVNSYNRNVNMWFIAERTYTLTKQQYKLLTHLFSMGKTSVYELITAHKEQLTAMKNYYNSVRDVWSSYFALRKLTLHDFEKKMDLIDLYSGRPVSLSDAKK